jgi:hypothetical protein
MSPVSAGPSDALTEMDEGPDSGTRAGHGTPARAAPEAQGCLVLPLPMDGAGAADSGAGMGSFLSPPGTTPQPRAPASLPHPPPGDLPDSDPPVHCAGCHRDHPRSTFSKAQQLLIGRRNLAGQPRSVRCPEWEFNELNWPSDSESESGGERRTRRGYLAVTPPGTRIFPAAPPTPPAHYGVPAHSAGGVALPPPAHAPAGPMEPVAEEPQASFCRPPWRLRLPSLRRPFLRILRPRRMTLLAGGGGS